MKKILITLLMICSLITTVSAHSGRTDSSGGHKDNKNVSGLGSYHYHCGGYPAHLHKSGYCPYRDTFPSSVKISAEKKEICIGEEITLTANVSPSDACSTKVNWKSSDTSVVTVKNGVVKAVGYGTATISASTFNDKIGEIKVTVKEILAESLSISPMPVSLFVGETSKLECTITPTNVDNATITWSSSDPQIATVSDDGTVTAQSAGKVTISATASNGVSTSVTLDVQVREVENVVIETETTEVSLGETISLVVAVSPQNATYQDVTWTSSDETILTVSEDGKVTPHKCGVATVTATSVNGIANTIEIEVKELKEVATEQVKDDEKTVENNSEEQKKTTEEKSDKSSAFVGVLVVVGVIVFFLIRKRKR